MSVLAALFGWPGAWGVGGNLIAWVICGVLAFAWLHAKEKARHLAKMAQAASHHKDQMALLVKQHQEQLALMARQHSQLSDAVAAVVVAPQAPAAERVVPAAKVRRQA